MKDTIKNRIIYFGSPDFSAQALFELHNYCKNHGLDISLVITQPDRKAGRGLIQRPTAVKEMARQLSIEVFEYHKESKNDLVSKIKEIAPKYGILYAFNELITQNILDLFPSGLWNLHPSLLPKYRGSSPVAYPILLGDSKTGVSIMKMDKGFDTGNVLLQQECVIQKHDIHIDLIRKLTTLGVDLLIKLLVEGVNNETPQDNKIATYTRKIGREDGYIELETLKSLLCGMSISKDNIQIIKDYYFINKYTPPEYLHPVVLVQLYNAFYPWPGLWTKVNMGGMVVRLKLHNITYDEENQKPKVERVQVEGKKPVDFTIWNGHHKIF
ncbi:MAG: methionyl-tRNA formyltransferase [Patescibacteria group bacterium]